MYAFGENGKEFIHDNAKPNFYIKKKKKKNFKINENALVCSKFYLV